jgi:hypothetical protein
MSCSISARRSGRLSHRGSIPRCSSQSESRLVNTNKASVNPPSDISKAAKDAAPSLGATRAWSMSSAISTKAATNASYDSTLAGYKPRTYGAAGLLLVPFHLSAGQEMGTPIDHWPKRVTQFNCHRSERPTRVRVFRGSSGRPRDHPCHGVASSPRARATSARSRSAPTATRAVKDYIVDLAVGISQPCRAASWASCTREVSPSLE